MHVDVHSLYGILETYETYKVLKEKFGQAMPFILTRNTFAGNGKFSAHWSGDNLANWEFLRLSIPAAMNSNVFFFTYVLIISQDVWYPNDRR